MIVSIGGVPGSGKTSAARILAEQLRMPYHSVGGLRAQLAHKRGITLDALNALGETDKTTDSDVDDLQRRLGETEDNFVIEGRLGWYFIPHSIKIFLTCDLDESAKRIFAARHATDERSDEPAYAHIEETKQAIEARMASDARRYEKWYGVNYLDPSHYDVIIDTTTSTGPERTAEQILAALRDRGVQS